MRAKTKLQLIVVAVLLATFAVSQVSFAQETENELVITSQNFIDARKDPGNCTGEFQTLVKDYFKQVNLYVTTVFETRVGNRDTSNTDCILRYYNPDTNEVASYSPDSLNWYESELRDSPQGITTTELQKRFKDEHPDETAFWKRVVDQILSFTFNVIALVLAVLANFGGWVLSKIASIGVVESMPSIVGNGWVIVRDFMNMFFILAMIAIAIGTILRIEQYNYRRLLVNLILMALLINFSKVIADQIIGIFDTVIRVFVGNGDFFTYSAFFDRLVRTPETYQSAGFVADLGDAFSGTVSSFWGMIYSVVATGVLWGIAILLLWRMVGLWVLVMISPIAYALYILPATRSHATRWWQTFFKYLIWGPVAIFFIKIANALVEAQASNETILGVSSMFDFLIVSGMMLAALLVAKQAGMVGAGAITSGAERSIRWGVGAANKYAARGSMFKQAGSLSSTAGKRLETKAGLKPVGKLFSGLGKASSGLGKGISAGTAAPQAAVLAVKEKFASEERQRKEQIKEMGFNQLAKRGMAGELDEETKKKFSKQQLVDYVARSGKGEQLKTLDQVGRKASEAMLLAMHDGLIKGSEQDMRELKEATYKAYATSRGIKEFEFEQNKQRYMQEDIKLTATGVSGQGISTDEAKEILEAEDVPSDLRGKTKVQKGSAQGNRVASIRIPKKRQDGTFEEEDKSVTLATGKDLPTTSSKSAEERQQRQQQRDQLNREREEQERRKREQEQGGSNPPTNPPTTT